MDPEIKKQTLRLLNYGLYVVTAVEGSAVAAGSVNWLSQASFEPPLVMVAVKKDSGLHGLVERSGKFAVNVLASDQKEAASAFFRSTEVKNGKLNGYEFEAGPETGAPLLLDLPGWFEARVTDTVKGGDGTISFRWRTFDWKTKYPALATEIAASHPKAVEPPVNFGEWRFVPKGSGSEVRYYVCSDTGGPLPKNVQEFAALQTLPDTVADLVIEGRKR